MREKRAHGVQTGPAAGDLPEMRTWESGCSGGKGFGWLVWVWFLVEFFCWLWFGGVLLLVFGLCVSVCGGFLFCFVRNKQGWMEASDTSNEASVKSVAYHGCPKTYIVFSFFIIWDVWKGCYSFFKTYFLLFIFPLVLSLWEAWDLPLWALAQHLFWPRFWSLLFLPHLVLSWLLSLEDMRIICKTFVFPISFTLYFQEILSTITKRFKLHWLRILWAARVI